MTTMAAIGSEPPCRVIAPDGQRAQLRDRQQRIRQSPAHEVAATATDRTPWITKAVAKAAQPKRRCRRWRWSESRPAAAEWPAALSWARRSSGREGSAKQAMAPQPPAPDRRRGAHRATHCSYARPARVHAEPGDDRVPAEQRRCAASGVAQRAGASNLAPHPSAWWCWNPRRAGEHNPQASFRETCAIVRQSALGAAA